MTKLLVDVPGTSIYYSAECIAESRKRPNPLASKKMGGCWEIDIEHDTCVRIPRTCRVCGCLAVVCGCDDD